MFPGHYQPHVPADLGFYDLRLAESRAAQAEMAKQYGIDAFCFYHYWFAGRKLLEQPLEAMLKMGQPDIGFCMCWANQSWTGIWHGVPNRMLIEQTYPGEDDHRAHFAYLLPFFKDPRYIRINGKPLFVVYSPRDLPDSRQVTNLWRQMAVEAGIQDLHLVGVADAFWVPQEHGFDASVTSGLPRLRELKGWVSWRDPMKKITGKVRAKRGLPDIHSYEKVISGLLPKVMEGVENYPCVIPNWDNTPRSGKRGLVLHGSTPELFRKHFREALELAQNLPDERQFVFIKSWNEWAEGNHLEPDLKYGHAYLEVVAEELNSAKQKN